VREVKPSTYFCNHCDTVFKLIDPTHVTVQREFCECGGAIAYQCRLCRTGICHGHDAWQETVFGDHSTVLDWVLQFTALTGFRWRIISVVEDRLLGEARERRGALQRIETALTEAVNDHL